MSDTNDLAFLFGSSSSSSSLSPEPPSDRVSETPDIGFIKQLAKKSFWDIEYELNIFAKTQGYRYILHRRGVPTQTRPTFRFLCSHHDQQKDETDDSSPSEESTPDIHGCQHSLSFRYTGDDDPLKGPFVLEEKNLAVLAHNHIPSTLLTEREVTSKEEKIRRYELRVAQNAKKRRMIYGSGGGEVQVQGNKPGRSRQLLDIRYHDSADEDGDQVVASDSLAEESQTGAPHAVSSSDHSQDEEGNESNGQDTPWKLNLYGLNHHIQRFKTKLQNGQNEIQDLKGRISILEYQLKEGNILMISKERDEYKRK